MAGLVVHGLNHGLFNEDWTRIFISWVHLKAGDEDLYLVGYFIGQGAI